MLVVFSNCSVSSAATSCPLGSPGTVSSQRCCAAVSRGGSQHSIQTGSGKVPFKATLAWHQAGQMFGKAWLCLRQHMALGRV